MNNNLSYDQAIQLLDVATSRATGTREDHQNFLAAIHTVHDYVKLLRNKLSDAVCVDGECANPEICKGACQKAVTDQKTKK